MIKASLVAVGDDDTQKIVCEVNLHTIPAVGEFLNIDGIDYLVKYRKWKIVYNNDNWKIPSQEQQVILTVKPFVYAK